MFIIIFIACSAGYRQLPVNMEARTTAPESRGSRMDEPDLKDRLVIKSASIRLEVIEQDTVHLEIMKLADKYDGYVMYSGNSKTSIRVPAEKFSDVITEIESYGKVVDKDITGQDVTEEYQDFNVRLENAKKTRQRYLALLNKANNVNEMLNIERELEKVNLEIERLKGKIEKMSHQVEYSIIKVNTSKSIRPGPVGYVFYGIYKGISWLFIWE